ncbi:hypothetical protein F0U60_29535 [Archangium minus]|uniref:Dickkopf N-terminal cysteine-rich domain-containing protein n=1 Tax=Archangium minus TaxID=83450 RepID=A0ABY9WXD3_9BACT|nr:hypothetical protein F0U60_29535 [Archangium minus]
MKNAWLSAVVLSVALAVSACGGTEETVLDQGNVEQQLPQCDENGECGPGFYCVGGPFGTCRPGAVEALLPMCTDDGRCPAGYYCDGGRVCRRQIIEAMPYQCTDEGRCPTGYYCDGGPGGICRRGVVLPE